jgi:hypothetical protein
MDLAEFLLARITDEESLARDAASEGNPHRSGWQLWTNKVDTTPGGEVLGPRGSVEAHPSRVLAECEAKRRIVELHAITVTEDWINPIDGPAYRDDDHSCAICGWVRDACETVKLLALPYADHPDYEEEWKP